MPRHPLALRPTVGVAALLVGCAAQVTAPVELTRIYEPDAAAAREELPATLMVPGIMGSRLVDPGSGRIYWGSVFGKTPNPSKSDEDLRALALPIDGATPFAELDDPIDADSVLLVVAAETPLGRVSLRGYPGLLEGVSAALVDERARAGKLAMGATDEAPVGIGGAPYDWRQDLVAAARTLARQVDDAVAARVKRGGPARVNLIGHSMGALVVRWYLLYGTADLPADGSPPPVTWAGAEHVRHVILVGPPNAGSVSVLESMVSGEQVNPVLPAYPPALVDTFPSAYVMLPRADAGAVVYADDGAPVPFTDVAEWERLGWGIFAAEEAPRLAALLPEVRDAEARRVVARRWVAAALARAGRIQAALDVRAEPPEHLRMHLFMGDSRRTPSVLAVDRTTGALSVRETAPGDGRVTRASALLDLRRPGEPSRRLDSPIRWDDVNFGNGEHFGIVSDSSFLDGLFWLLLTQPE